MASPWRVVCCPGEVRFAQIAKERQTLARIYALYRDDQTLWLGQSISRLIPFLGEHSKLRVHLSSAYRIIRGECKSGRHNGFAVKRLEDARQVNERAAEVARRRCAGPRQMDTRGSSRDTR